MTRRPTSEDDDEDPGERPPTRLETAVEAHRDRFGAAPGLFRLELLGLGDALAPAVERAVRDGVPLDVAALEARHGLALLPLNANA